MARKFLTAVDLSKNELQNAQVQNLASAPGTPVAGQIYFNTSDSTLYWYSGSGWVAAKDAGATSVYNQTVRDDGTARTQRAAINFVSTTSVALSATDDGGNDETEITADVQFGNVTGQTSYGSSSANGTASTVARSDHTHGTPPLTNTTPTGLTVGGSSTVGTGTAPAREDHVHSLPNWGSVTAQTSFGASSGNGSNTTFARSDHTHGTPTHDGAAHSGISISSLAAATGTYSFGAQLVQSSATPAGANDLTNKAYVDAFTQGLDFKASVRVAATTNGALASAYDNSSVVDGVTLATGDRILLAGQTTASENGIYIVQASGAPVRATDADASGEISRGTLVYVEEGTAAGGQQWVCTATGATPWVPGSSSSTWTMYFAATSTQAGDGLTATGNVFNVGAGTGISVAADTVAVDGTWFATSVNSEIDGAAGNGLTSSGGVLAVGQGTGITVSADSIAVASGYVDGEIDAAAGNGLTSSSGVLAVGQGTGISVAADAVAVDTAVVVRKYAVSVGNGALTSIPVTHNLGSRDVTVAVYDNTSPYAEVFPDVQHTDANTVTLLFAAAPTSNQYRCVVHG